MKSFTIFSAIGFAAIVAAYAVPEASGQLEKRDVQSVDLLFLAGPASYNLTIPADGQEYFTDDGLSVNLVISDNYDPSSHCHFKTADQVALAPSLIQRPQDFYPINEIAVGPPQPIISVTCSGVCLGIYGDCYNSQGQFVAPCCNGFCAADKCRPYQLNG